MGLSTATFRRRRLHNEFDDDEEFLPPGVVIGTAPKRRRTRLDSSNSVTSADVRSRTQTLEFQNIETGLQRPDAYNVEVSGLRSDVRAPAIPERGRRVAEAFTEEFHSNNDAIGAELEPPNSGPVPGLSALGQSSSSSSEARQENINTSSAFQSIVPESFSDNPPATDSGSRSRVSDSSSRNPTSSSSIDLSQQNNLSQDVENNVVDRRRERRRVVSGGVSQPQDSDLAPTDSFVRRGRLSEGEDTANSIGNSNNVDNSSIEPIVERQIHHPEDSGRFSNTRSRELLISPPHRSRRRSDGLAVSCDDDDVTLLREELSASPDIVINSNNQEESSSFLGEDEGRVLRFVPCTLVSNDDSRCLLRLGPFSDGLSSDVTTLTCDPEDVAGSQGRGFSTPVSQRVTTTFNSVASFDDEDDDVQLVSGPPAINFRRKYDVTDAEFWWGPQASQQLNASAATTSSAPEDPVVSLSKLMKNLSCPICYRSLRRSRVMEKFTKDFLNPRRRKWREKSLAQIRVAKAELERLEQELEEGRIPTKEKALKAAEARKQDEATQILTATNSTLGSATFDENAPVKYGGSSADRTDKSDIPPETRQQQSFSYAKELKLEEFVEFDDSEETVDLRVARCGHVYCDDCIKAHIRVKRTCPVCNQTVLAKHLYPLYL